MVRYWIRDQRVLVVAVALALMLSASATLGAFGGSSSAEFSTVYACKDDRSGTLTNVSIDEVPNCGLRSTLVSWVSVDLESLDDVYVNEGQPDAISTGMIQAGAVTNDELANDSVSESKLAENSVSSSKIQSNSVGTDELTSNSVNADTVIPDEVQLRVDNVCPAGAAVRGINVDGTVTCESTGSISETSLITSNMAIDQMSRSGATISCGSGSTAISGGVQWLDVSNASPGWLTIHQSYQHDQQSWVFDVGNANPDMDMIVQIQVICLSS